MNDTIKKILDSSAVVKENGKMYYTGTVKSCVQTDYPPDDHGNVSYSLKFVDQFEGLFKSKKNQDHFVPGGERTCLVEIKTSKQGNEWLSLKRDDRDKREYSGPPKSKSGNSNYQPKDQDAIVRDSSIKEAMNTIDIFGWDLVKAKQVWGDKPIIVIANRYVQYCHTLSEENKNQNLSISAQSSIKLALQYIKLFGVAEDKKNLEYVLSLAVAYFNFITVKQ